MKIDLVATATRGAIVLTGKTNITFMGGKAGIRIADGYVDIFGPTRVHLHTAGFDAPEPRGIGDALPQLDLGSTRRKFQLIRPANNESIASQSYETVKRDGNIIKGISSALGEIELHESQAADMLAIKFG